MWQMKPRNIWRIKVPIPPIEVQNEIAEFLDRFINLERELEKELKNRILARRYRFQELWTKVFKDV